MIVCCFSSVLKHNDRNLVTENLKFTSKFFSLQLDVHSNHRILLNRALESYGNDEDFKITCGNPEGKFQ